MQCKLSAGVSLQTLNTGLASIAHKYSDGKMKSTLVRELNQSLKPMRVKAGDTITLAGHGQNL